MRHRHVVAVDRILDRDRLRGGIEMRDDLMPEQVEIDPRVAAAPFRAAERAAVESTRGSEVVDGKGEVKRAEGHGGPAR